MLAPNPSPPQEPKLLDQLRGKIRLKHYSIRTEQFYAGWVKRFIVHHGKRRPHDVGAREAEAFVAQVGVERQVYAPRARRVCGSYKSAMTSAIAKPS